MTSARHTVAFSLAFVVLLLLASPMVKSAPRLPAEEGGRTRVRIELTAGDDKKPVPDASVYVKFPQNPKAPNGKQVELNLKTNQQGIALSPAVPQGKILVQVIAPGWKTYGEWFDVKQEEKIIPIHLVRPTTPWY